MIYSFELAEQAKLAREQAPMRLTLDGILSDLNILSRFL
jgi:hypothetical protein